MAADRFGAIVMENHLRLPNIKRMAEFQPVQYCDPQHFREYTGRAFVRMGEAHGEKTFNSLVKVFRALVSVTESQLKNDLNGEQGCLELRITFV